MSVTANGQRSMLDKARLATEAAKRIVGDTNYSDLSPKDQTDYTELLAIASVQARIAHAEAAEREATATERIVELLEPLSQVLGLLGARFG